MNNLHFQKDEWLTDLLGCDTYHLTGKLSNYDEIVLPHSRAFVDVKVSVDKVSHLITLQDKGFRLVDTNVQLLRRANRLVIDSNECRFANEQDYEEVCKIASTSFTKSRFHLDPNISDATANIVKREWASNFFSGKRGEWMIVAQKQGAVVGFLQALRRLNSIVIDLIAVESGSRGQGIAASMVSFANKKCLSATSDMNVGTQISNIASLDFYLKLGFKIVASDYVLHLHQK